jgi:restriction system protein
MGRRDQGIISQLTELSDAVPAVGLVLAISLAVLGGYLRWVNPAFMYGLGPVWAIVAWLLAALFGGTAAGGFVRRRIQHRARVRRLGQTRTLEDLRQLSPAEFEQVIADHYRREGYRVTETGGPGDGGVDLILRRTGPTPSALTTHLVQCKRYRNGMVGVAEVRNFYGAMAAHVTRCEGIIVTCGGFTADAVNFAADKPIRLIPGSELVWLLANANGLRPAVANYTPPPAGGLAPSDVTSNRSAPTSNVPRCPKCRTPMVIRTARRGSNAGRPFWGCGRYPQCNMIINIA